MKKLDYVILTIFSVFILIISIMSILISVGIIDVDIVGKFLGQALTGAKTSNIVVIISALFACLSLKGIFFTDLDKEKNSKQSGVLMENGNGKLMISRATLENLVNSVVKEFDSAEDIKTIIDFDENNNVKVSVNLIVSKNVIIKELSLNLQHKIKEAIKKTSDLEVKEVNVQIKNIASQNKDNK